MSGAGGASSATGLAAASPCRQTRSDRRRRGDASLGRTNASGCGKRMAAAVMAARRRRPAPLRYWRRRRPQASLPPQMVIHMAVDGVARMCGSRVGPVRSCSPPAAAPCMGRYRCGVQRGCRYAGYAAHVIACAEASNALIVAPKHWVAAALAMRARSLSTHAALLTHGARARNMAGAIAFLVHGATTLACVAAARVTGRIRAIAALPHGMDRPAHNGASAGTLPASPIRTPRAL